MAENPQDDTAILIIRTRRRSNPHLLLVLRLKDYFSPGSPATGVDLELAVAPWMVTSSVPCTSPSHIRVPEAGAEGAGSGSGAGLGAGCGYSGCGRGTGSGSVSSLTICHAHDDGFAHRSSLPRRDQRNWEGPGGAEG